MFFSSFVGEGGREREIIFSAATPKRNSAFSLSLFLFLLLSTVLQCLHFPLAAPGAWLVATPLLLLLLLAWREEEQLVRFLKSVVVGNSSMGGFLLPGG